VCGLYGRERAIDGPNPGTVSLLFDRGGRGPVSPECGTVKIELRCGTDVDPMRWHVEQRSVNVFLPSVTVTTIWTEITLGCEDYTPSSGLSGGWWFVIWVVLGTSIYLGGGFLYKTKKMGTTGIESIPNIDFWREVPSLVGDGGVFFMEWARDRWERLNGRATDEYSPI
jgi:hypothetical protein